eukprot:163762-Lingulodinium_polyedra.AAC.1
MTSRGRSGTTSGPPPCGDEAVLPWFSSWKPFQCLPTNQRSLKRENRGLARRLATTQRPERS